MQEEYRTSGIRKLDEILGGGFLKGTQNVVYGGTGLGKTRLLVQTAEKQEEHHAIFYDNTMTTNPQPIIRWFKEFHDREVSNWDRNVEEILHRGHVEKVLQDPRITRALVLPYANISGNNPFRSGAAYKSDAENLAKYFLVAHLSKGSKTVIVDGFRNPGNLPEIPRIQAMDYFTLWNRVRHNELVVSQSYSYDPEDVTFLVGETSDHMDIDVIREEFNLKSVISADADTVILLGKQDKTTVLEVRKLRFEPQDGKRYRLIEDRKLLDIEEL